MPSRQSVQVENPRPNDCLRGGQLRHPPTESHTRHPHLRARCLESRDKRGCLLRCRRPAAGGWMSHHAPELEHHREADSPSVAMATGPRDGVLRGSVLGHGRPMRVDEQIRVERDHQPRRNHSLIADRSAKSTPRGRPPSTVTHRIAGRDLGVARRSPCSSRRRPRSTSSRNVERASAACFLAATKRSSGNSMVVFIWFYRLPYLWVAPVSIETRHNLVWGATRRPTGSTASAPPTHASALTSVTSNPTGVSPSFRHEW